MSPSNENSWFSVDNLDDVISPGLLVYPDRIAENLRRMIALVGGDATRLRPHVKTHKMADIVKLKLAMGITKFKTATIAETEMVLAAGGRDVLLAYPVVGPNINRFIALIEYFKDSRIAALVDDTDVMQEIARAAKSSAVTVELLLDINVGMDRTGVPPDKAIELYQQLCKTPNVKAAGFHIYDGHIHSNDAITLQRITDQAFESGGKIRQQLEHNGFGPIRIVASGTPTSKLLATWDNVEVGMGTPVLWDFGQPTISPDLDFLNAAVVLTRVISRPAPGLVCLDAGHKSIASESPPPRLRFLNLPDAVEVRHSEEHLVIATEHANELPPGSVLYALPRHVCPTIALHQQVHCIRNHQVCETWPVTARNRILNH